MHLCVKLAILNKFFGGKEVIFTDGHLTRSIDVKIFPCFEDEFAKLDNDVSEKI